MLASTVSITVVLQVCRIKWINAEKVLIEGTTVDKMALPHSDHQSVVASTACFAPPGKSCLLTIQTEDSLSLFSQAAESLNLCVLQQKHDVAKKDTTRWTKVEINERNGEKRAVFLAIKCPQSTERNRKGVRMLNCHNFVHFWLDPSPMNEKSRCSTKQKICGNGCSTASFGLQSKDRRHELFAEWIVTTYGLHKVVLDVAGGNGRLSRALVRRGVEKVILLDPNPRLSCSDSDKDDRIAIVPHPLIGDGSDLLQDTLIGPLLHETTLIVGMHPDQATEAMMDLAVLLGRHVPVALVPCCVMPKLFSHRRQCGSGDPIRSYKTFCQYLLEKGDYHETHLPFDGRNKIIYCQTVSPALPLADK